MQTSANGLKLRRPLIADELLVGSYQIVRLRNNGGFITLSSFIYQTSFVILFKFSVVSYLYYNHIKVYTPSSQPSTNKIFCCIYIYIIYFGFFLFLLLPPPVFLTFTFGDIRRLLLPGTVCSGLRSCARFYYISTRNRIKQDNLFF